MIGLAPGVTTTRSGVTRIRPVLMTSLAFVLGLAPLVFATGVALLTRRGVGTAVFGGILNAAVSRHAIENGDNIQRIMNPTLRASMPASELNFLIERMSAGLHNIYLIIGLLVLVILLAILALPARLRV